MKRILPVIAGFIIVLSFCAAYADEIAKLRSEIEFYQNKLYDVEDYVKSLKDKASTAKNAKKLAELNALSSKQKEKIPVLEKEILSREEQIEKIESAVQIPTAKKAVVPVPPKPAPFKMPQISLPKGLIVNAGLKAGTTVLGLGITPALTLPPIPKIGKVETRINVEYGIGKYNILLLQIGGIANTGGSDYAGLTLDIVNYTNRAKNIPGMAYIIEKGLSAGASMFWGRNLGRFAVEAGYSNVLGFSVSGRYKLN